MRTFTPKAFTTLFSLIAFLCFSSISVFAQQFSPSEKKIVVNQKTIDKEGNTSTERFVFEGEAAQSFNIDRLIELELSDKKYTYDVAYNVKNFNDVSVDQLENDVVEKMIIDIEETTTKQSEGKPLLGVYVDLSYVSRGVRVENPIEGRGAIKAGISSKDIILDINDLPTNSYDELVDVLSEYKPGEEVDVRYSRSGTTNVVKVTLTRNDDDARYRSHSNNYRNHQEVPQQSIFNNDSNKLFGSSGSNEKPKLGVSIGNTDTNEGVRILRVFNGTAADLGGLRPNDIIEKVDKQKVNSINELIKVISNYNAGDQIRIRYIRNGVKEKVKLILKAEEKHNYTKSYRYGGCGSDNHHRDRRHSRHNWNDVDVEKENRRIVITKKEKETIERLTNPSINTAPDFDFAQLELAEMELFPNPSAGRINIKFTATENIPTLVTIVDVTGKEIFRDQLNNFNGRYEKQIDITKNGEGIYILNITQNNKTFSEKIIYSTRNSRG